MKVMRLRRDASLGDVTRRRGNAGDPGIGPLFLLTTA